ncbi:MAG: TIGR01244 family sulfur transferase [Sphingomonadaceae bacterium]|nr:TIGR01244 family phosphatase [Sphingomonadaceae bacterium]
MEVKQLDDTLSVRGQIAPAEVAEAAAMGFRSIICNRPDGEQPHQPDAEAIAAAAGAAGMEFCHIPIVPGQITPEKIAAFEAALKDLPGPILAYCRTGTRSAMLWGLHKAPELGADGAMQAAADAGCDIAQARPLIEQRAS